MVAESSKSKSDNVFEHTLANGDTIRLLKSAVIYGPNASGKSNLLKALQTLRRMVRFLGKVNDPVIGYDPFLFQIFSRNAPTKFMLSFIGPGNYKYIYEITFNSVEVLEETLEYYLKSQKRNLFKRTKGEDSGILIHTVNLGQDFSNKTLKVFKNQTVLSKFGTEDPDDFLSPVYLYFKDELAIFGDRDLVNINDYVEEKIHQSPFLLKRLSSLMKVADTKINGLVIKPVEDDERYKTNGLSFYPGLGYFSYGRHSIYKGHEQVDETELPLTEESKGSNVLFELGAEILDKLDKGGVFLVDEIDTSLHPMVAKFLVMLFQHPRSNPHNAQLIFTTHETTFLDKDIFRKDQIWFTEKNERGESELFSVQDFDNAREDTPFEKWYLAGKFGGIPNIREIEFIFQDEQEA